MFRFMDALLRDILSVITQKSSVNLTLVIASLNEEKIRKQIMYGVKHIMDNNAMGIFMILLL